MQAGCTEGDEDENETVELMAARLLKAHKEDVWGANRAGADGVVLGACRGVAGGALRLGQGAGSTRIAQGRRVGRLQPKVHSLGVAGQFGDVVE